jgi:predicted DNA-binding transcriptional regulator AlpA
MTTQIATITQVRIPHGFVNLAEILNRGKFSKSHLYNLLKGGQFPEPALRVGPRFTRWSAAEVDAWFADPVGWMAGSNAVTESAPTVGCATNATRVASSRRDRAEGGQR